MNHTAAEVYQEELEIIQLEEWMEAELKCEAQHGHGTLPDCSGEVTHMFGNECIPGKLKVCLNTAEYVLSCSTDDSLCGHCENPTSECWEVVPI